MPAILLYGTLCATLMLFPLLVALVHQRRSEGDALPIDQDRPHDNRRWGQGLATAMRHALDLASPRAATVSLPDGATASLWRGDTPVNAPADQILACLTPQFEAPAHLAVYPREVYCAGDAHFARRQTTLAAAFAEGTLALAPGTVVESWVDAEGALAAAEHCDLGASASSATSLDLGQGTRFVRLAAPAICTQARPGSDVVAARPSPLGWPAATREASPRPLRNIAYVTERHCDDGTLVSDIITHRGLTIGAGLVVGGDIRSHRAVRVADNAVVTGNIFAEDGIVLGKGAVVLGNLFTQGDIDLGEGSAVGRPGHTSSVVARNQVTLRGSNTVYGYVESGHGGMVGVHAYERHDLGLAKARDGQTTRPRRRLHARTRQRGTALRKRDVAPWAVGIAALVAIVVGTGVFVDGQVTRDPTASRTPEDIDAVGSSGLPGGAALATDPIWDDGVDVVYPDRVVRRFYYTAAPEGVSTAQTSRVASTVMAMRERAGQHQANFYLLPVPSRIVLEDGFEGDALEHQALLDDLSAQASEAGATLIDVLPSLRARQDEYLYYRTESCWTMLGALYAMEAYAQEADLSWEGPGAYNRMYFTRARGNYLQSVWSAASAAGETELLDALSDVPGDYEITYLLPSAKNRGVVTMASADGTGVTQIARRAVLTSTFGTHRVLGNRYLHAVLEGDGLGSSERHRGALLICDTNGKMLAPYLENYYETVYVVNVQLRSDFDTDFEQILQEYQIDDVIWAQSASRFGNRSYTAAINAFVTE